MSARLLVAIHDVAPPFAEECAALWALCRAVEVVPALLVVPQWHGAWPLARDPRLVRWIGGRVADGAEVLLHGARHDEVGVRRGVADHWRAAGRTDGEGEFLTLDRAMARGRIAEGLDGLERLGLRAVGFVPPAWLTSRDTWRAVADCGLAVSEGADGVVALPGQRVVRAPAVRWSARTRWRAAGSMWVATARRRWHADAPLVRVALHPRDLHHAGVAASLRSALEWWRRHRAPTGYLAVAEQAA